MVDAVSANLPPVLPASSQATGISDSTAAPAATAPVLPGQKTGSESGAGSGQSRNKEFDNKALDQIAARLVDFDSRLAISRDTVIQRFIYKFVNPNNGQVLHQYPQPMTLDSLHAIAEAYKRFLDEHA